MGRLEKIHDEHFAQRIALGYEPYVAWTLTGMPYCGDVTDSARMLTKRRDIATRVAELRRINEVIMAVHEDELTEAIERPEADLTVVEYRRQLLVNIKLARDAGKMKEANDALLMLGRTLGYLADAKPGRPVGYSPLAAKRSPTEQRQLGHEEEQDRRKEVVKDALKRKPTPLSEIAALLDDESDDG
jgi:hypothetical protein